MIYKKVAMKNIEGLYYQHTDEPFYVINLILKIDGKPYYIVTDSTISYYNKNIILEKARGVNFENSLLGIREVVNIDFDTILKRLRNGEHLSALVENLSNGSINVDILNSVKAVDLICKKTLSHDIYKHFPKTMKGLLSNYIKQISPSYLTEEGNKLLNGDLDVNKTKNFTIYFT